MLSNSLILSSRVFHSTSAKMKVSTILVSALATLVAAAPTEKRGSNDFSQLNNLASFSQVNLNYLLNINQLDLAPPRPARLGQQL